MRARAPLAALALLAGCTVGPHYAGPPVAAPKAAQRGGFVRAGDGVVAVAPGVARWWQALGDPVLDTLEERALAANPNLAAAAARLRQARATVREQRANRLPSANASALYAHAHIPGLDLNGGDDAERPGADDETSDLNLYNIGFDASWEVDLFGGRRRAIEAARATAGRAEASLADAQVSLTAEVAQTYLGLRDRQRRIALTIRSVALQEEMLVLVRQRYDRGTAARLDVERARQQLDMRRADATPINAELDAYRNALATLAGDEPGAIDALLAPARPIPLPPAAIAIGDPASLVRRRPDIRAAERGLAADTARVGEAEAARFPRLSIMGILGLGGTNLSDLTKLDDFAAVAAPQLSFAFLDFGRTRARVRRAEAVRDEAEASYRATVLAALRDVEDALSRFRYRRITVATLARARGSADVALTLTRQRYAAGTTTRIDLLDTQRQQIAADLSLSAAQAALTGDFVAIQKSLGLGWAAPAAETAARGAGAGGRAQPSSR